jgi:hypothetical protein
MKKDRSFTFFYDSKTREAMDILMSKSINLGDFCRKSIESFAEQIEEAEGQRRDSKI